MKATKKVDSDMMVEKLIYFIEFVDFIATKDIW